MSWRQNCYFLIFLLLIGDQCYQQNCLHIVPSRLAAWWNSWHGSAQPPPAPRKALWFICCSTFVYPNGNIKSSWGFRKSYVLWLFHQWAVNKLPSFNMKCDPKPNQTQLVTHFWFVFIQRNLLSHILRPAEALKDVKIRGKLPISCREIITQHIFFFFPILLITLWPLESIWRPLR